MGLGFWLMTRFAIICQIYVVDGGVVEIYVETVMADEANESGSKDDSDFEDELEHMSHVDDECDGGHDDSDDEVFEPVREILVIASTPEKEKRDIEKVRAFRSPSPKNKGKAVVEAEDTRKAVVVAKDNLKIADLSESDSDYIGGDSCSSEEDEEVKQIRKDCNEFKKKLKDGELGNLDDVIYMGQQARQMKGLWFRLMVRILLAPMRTVVLMMIHMKKIVMDS